VGFFTQERGSPETGFLPSTST